MFTVMLTPLARNKIPNGADYGASAKYVVPTDRCKRILQSKAPANNDG